MNVLRDLETAAKSENTKDKYKEVAGKYQISKSMVWKWSKQEQDLKQEADKIRAKRKRIGADSSGTGRTRRRLRNYYLKNYPLAEQKLLSDFRKHRSRGLKVGGRWLKIKMRQSLRLFYGDEVADNFKGSKNWLHRFSERNFISLRRRTNKKKIGNTEKLPIIQSFHLQLRKDVQSRKRHNYSIQLDDKWGRWVPTRRYNMDQVPCPFVIDQQSTYDKKGTNSVWISQPGSGLDKRQCTLQLCISPEDEQHVPPAIIFRGKGNVSRIEKDAYDKRVHVYWQKNAWMDRSVALNWIKQTFAPAVDKSSENVLFLDNLGCQMTEEFHATCRELASTVVYPLPPEETDKCQPIDQGEGFLIKKLMGKELDKHLEESDNLEKWQSSFSASERRILLTEWLGSAWELINSEYPGNRKKLFQRTGLLMTADGSDDNLIQPEGFADYSF